MPCPEGVTVIFRATPLPLKEVTEPFVTVTSEAVNPVGTSEKVIVKGIGDIFVGDGALLVTVTVGLPRSYITETSFDVSLLLPALSAAIPAGRDTVTMPSIDGVISIV